MILCARTRVSHEESVVRATQKKQPSKNANSEIICFGFFFVFFLNENINSNENGLHKFVGFILLLFFLNIYYFSPEKI